MWAGIWKWFLLMAAVNAISLNRTRTLVKNAHDQTEKNTGMLKTFSNFLTIIENKKFDTGKLRNIHEKVEAEKGKASAQIARLSKLFSNLEAGRNAYFYIIANFTFLWDVHWLYRIERFRNNLKEEPEKWFEALFELEALSSLAAVCKMNPEWTFPEISDLPFYYKAENVSHPLIFAENKVANNFYMEGISSCWIITGSNMSGKSTFLRTLGINAVLALAGAPVSASKLEISPLKVFTSMRTEDSLAESTSSFYAELKRLKQLLDSIEPGFPIFYLLDEILKGTNSADRHTGGKALVRQLQGQNASGIIATHDLELARLEEEKPEKIKNFSFSSEVANGTLSFDYKLKEGVCKSFNASQLMKQMGIDIEKGTL
jgi:dsDNA-specific endonuclease/ATPase MutS2